MLGERIDYHILSPLVHRRNIATEEELNSRASQASTLTIDSAMARLNKWMHRLEGQFPVSDTLRYLDIGCGSGDITIALAKSGCRNITGIDIMPRSIAQATQNAERLQVADCIRYVCQDIHGWAPGHQYDVVMSHEALEHIANPKQFLQRLRVLVTPEGMAVLAFGPLFHSPFDGDHMGAFFRIPIPWRGVIFSEKAALRLRRECFRPTDMAHRYQDITGGLNLMRYSEFLRYVDAAGWEFSFLRVNPQLKRFPPLHHLSNLLIRLPVLRDYFASSVYAVLRRRSS